MNDRRNIAIGPGREFDFVRTLLARWGDRASGVGDDAALLKLPAGATTVVSTDTSIEAIHFRREWLTPEEIAFRATTAALSDLAAMAAAPHGLVVALTLPDRWIDMLERLADGIGEAAALAECPIVGGDITRGGELGLTITVVGSAERPARRDAVAPGDHVYVTGVLGGPATALAALLAGDTPDPHHRERFARPRARLREARWLVRHGARAMIDVSDGLMADLGHLAVASGVELRVDADRIPVMRGAGLADAARGGEEYELVVAAPHALDADAFARAFAIPLSEIARARVAEGPTVAAYRGGERVDLGGGHDHFSS